MSSVYYYVVGKHGNMYYKNGHEISKEQSKGHVVPKRTLRIIGPSTVHDDKTNYVGTRHGYEGMVIHHLRTHTYLLLLSVLAQLVFEFYAIIRPVYGDRFAIVGWAVY